ncbi:hypothetical protein THF1C08_60126 [Vibrio jasicida]|uniref:DUF1127 domain-containing protein n=1 Tax=Vibrio jasicida TaxID=766224 RepID=A0AAU9QQ97_9VIBR|nr:hypothetical protein THF1A12_30109 [Vibrio jasicida]CAH1600412.1 hypothetical protein THF1C08_60126 [Vibrio jasicida]
MLFVVSGNLCERKGNKHLLDDIGYNESEVQKEIQKPFWRD